MTNCILATDCSPEAVEEGRQWNSVFRGPKCAFFLAVVATAPSFPVGSFGLLSFHVSVLCPTLDVFSTPLPWTSSPGRGPPLSQLSDYARPENPQTCTLVPLPEFGSSMYSPATELFTFQT